MKYKTKVELIEATQWFKHGDHPAVIKVTDEIYDNLSECLQNDFDNYSAEKEDIGLILGQNGGSIILTGDWIVENQKHNIEIYDPIRFEKIFEKVEW